MHDKLEYLCNNLQTTVQILRNISKTKFSKSFTGFYSTVQLGVLNIRVISRKEITVFVKTIATFPPGYTTYANGSLHFA